MIGLSQRYRKPNSQKLTSGFKPRCQHLTHRGGKPGVWVQCRLAIKDGNKKYCAKHGKLL